MHDDWRDLPLNPDVKRYIEATRQASMDERDMLVRFAPVLCRCRPWYDHQDRSAPQEDCYVHTTIMFAPDGQWKLPVGSLPPVAAGHPDRRGALDGLTLPLGTRPVPGHGLTGPVLQFEVTPGHFIPVLSVTHTSFLL